MTNSTGPRLSDVVDRLRRLIRSQEYAAGLNPAQWEALRYFDRCNRFSNQPAALAAFLGATKGTVSQTVGALERKGLVRKARAAAGRRGVTVAVTAMGQALLVGDPLKLLDRDERYMDPAVAGLLARILGDLQRARGVRSFGMCRTCRYFQADAPDGGPHRCALLKLSLGEDDSGRICAEHEARDAA